MADILAKEAAEEAYIDNSLVIRLDSENCGNGRNIVY